MQPVIQGTKPFYTLDPRPTILHLYINATPQETGLTAPLSEMHIPVYTQEPSLLSRQGCAQQAYTSQMTTYQHQNSNVISNQECSQPHITSTPGQIPCLHQAQQQLPPSI